MLLLLAFVCLAGALVLVGQLVTKPTRARQESLRRAKLVRRDVTHERS